MPRRRPLMITALLAVGLLAVTGCGDDAPQSQTELAQERAQQGLLQSYTADYELLTSAENGGGEAAGTMTVSRTPSSLRLDIVTSAGTATSITTPERTVACQKPTDGKAPTCLTVAGAGKTPPAAFDPVLRKAFGDVLRVLAAAPAGLEIAGDADDTMTAAGQDCRYFTVTSSPGNKVPAGAYCLNADGVPVKLEFASGDALLTELDRTVPPAATFTPAVSPAPLPAS